MQKNVLDILNRDIERQRRDDDFYMAAMKWYKDKQKTKKKKGSIDGRRKALERHRLEGHKIMKRQYFSRTDSYDPEVFRRRYRMSRRLFVRIANDVRDYDDYFIRKRDGSGLLGFSTIQKITAAMRQLTQGISSDTVSEYTRLSESTARESLKRFCKAIIALYKDHYLRKPTAEDIKQIQEVNAARGFPGMLGSLDCMHWQWDNCPTAHAGMYKGKERVPTLVLEAVADKDTWIWHAFFGCPGSLNDLNVLDRSPLFDELAKDESPPSGFILNNKEFEMGYYLVDGIYPPYSVFIPSFPSPQTQKQQVSINSQIT